MDDEISSRFIFFSPWSFLFIFLLIIIGNLFIIDVALFSGKPLNIPFRVGVTAPTPKTVPAVKEATSCPISCQQEIQRATKASAIAKEPIVQNIVAPTAKEYYITLGSGSDTSADWSDITGASGYINNSAYGTIKTVTFEVSLYTPTGNQTAYARLYNVTDKHPVWNSDVSIEGGTSQLKISSPIILDNGSKLYQVQMKTQLQSRTNLENARIHILTY